MPATLPARHARDTISAMKGPALLLCLCAAAAAVGGTPPAAAAPPLWEVHAAERFCFAWHSGIDAARTELGIAVDGARRTTLILANPDWRLEDGRRYALEGRVGGRAAPAEAYGVRIRSGPEVVALAVSLEEPGFSGQIEAVAEMRFRTRGGQEIEAAVDPEILRSAAPALAEAGRCAERIEERRMARMDLDHRERFRSDPPPIWIPGGGSN